MYVDEGGTKNGILIAFFCILVYKHDPVKMTLHNVIFIRAIHLELL